MDSRAGANANMGANYTEDVDSIRSDTVMLMNILANRKRMVVISFPPSPQPDDHPDTVRHLGP
nr:hypothetical protein [Mycobacterium leprae]